MPTAHQAARRSIAIALAAGLASLLTGCGGAFNTKPIPVAGSVLQGNVHGGQQPIAGSNILLYAAGTTGYSAVNTNLFATPVTTDAGGNFTFSSYKCTAGQQLYVVASGGNPGNPGGQVNGNAVLMSALGDCSSLKASTYVEINEITTVGSVFALAPFMSGYTALGSSPSNTAGLERAFASVNKLVDIASGHAGGSALPAGATAPITEIYTLADILAACVNSTGGVAGDNTTACGTLFTLTTPAGGTAPTDTVQAALNIAHNPTLNVDKLWRSSPRDSPFAPQLTAPPTDWTLAITYATGGFKAPKSTTVDAQGNIWVANSANNSVTVLAQTGQPLTASPFTGNGLSAPAAVAIDAGGNGWVANQGGSTVSAFTPTGGSVSGSPFAGSGTIAAPTSIAIDAPGNLWIANSGNSSVTQLTSAGTYVRQVSSGIATPQSLAIDPE